MKPAGVIITYMDWRKWKTWWFNIPLMLFQLTFMVVGKIISKVDTPLRRVWRAAQANHVRLVLWEAEAIRFGIIPSVESRPWVCINFGYPVAELHPWYNDWNDGKRFEYREPTFNPTPLFIERMITYAHDQVEKPVARKYDFLQLLSFLINFPIWVFRWGKWGKEVIKWFNLPGGREICSSGVTACLWFGEATERTPEIAILQDEDTTFFKGYDIAMVMPCMFVISEKWKIK